jgi:hypothetical protein
LDYFLNQSEINHSRTIQGLFPENVAFSGTAGLLRNSGVLRKMGFPGKEIQFLKKFNFRKKSNQSFAKDKPRK